RHRVQLDGVLAVWAERGHRPDLSRARSGDIIIDLPRCPPSIQLTEGRNAWFSTWHAPRPDGVFLGRCRTSERTVTTGRWFLSGCHRKAALSPQPPFSGLGSARVSRIVGRPLRLANVPWHSTTRAA